MQSLRSKNTFLIAGHCSKVFEIFGYLNDTTAQCGIAFDIFEAEIFKLKLNIITFNGLCGSKKKILLTRHHVGQHEYKDQ